MTRKPTNFEIAVFSLKYRKRFNYDSHRTDRGYSTNGEKLWLNGHLLAQWHAGAVRMFLNDPKWHSFMVARAIPKVRDFFQAAGLLADRDEIACKEHEDCRSCLEMSKACAEERWTKPLPLPYFEAQAERRRRKEKEDRHAER